MMGQFVFNTETAATNQNKPYYMYVFPADSIAGFDQNNCNQEALNRKCFGAEYHRYNYAEKRRFINQKYNINPYNYQSNTTGNPYSNSSSSNNAKPIITNSSVINNAPCVNEDFEASPATALSTAASAIGNTLTGWAVTSGNTMVSPYNNCTNNNCCGNPGCTFSWVRQTPWVAPAITSLGTINTSPFGGTKVLQLNDEFAGGKAVRIQQTFPVTANNCLFQLAFRSALLSGHACCENPFIKITVINCFNQVLACPKIDVQPPGPSCASVTATGWQTNSSTWVTYTPNWIIKSLDLTPYLNSCVTIRIECGDCPYGGHWGTSYIDTQCLPLNVNVNNVPFSAAQPISAIAACGVLTATIVAPPGMGPYLWQGPASSTINSQTSQTIVTAVAGNYTLTMNPPGSCAPITKTLNLQFGSYPVANFSVTNNCTTYTITNLGTSSPSVQKYVILGPGGPPTFTTTSPTSVINLAPNTTYTIIQTVTNPQNCSQTFSMVITTPNGPNPAFNASPSFTLCVGQNPIFTAVTSAGSHTYSFASNTISPGPGFSDPYGPVVFGSPGTYTVTHTISTAGCVASTSSVLTINPLPQATLNAVPPLCLGSTATLNAVGGPGILTWTGPNNYSATGPTVMVTNFQPVNQGIYTLTINNFGCILTKTVSITAPAGPTVTISNNGPVCAGSPLTFSASWTSSVAPSYYYWYTYVSSPYFYYYGGYNVANPTIAVTTTANTQNYVFYIQFGSSCPVMTFTSPATIITLTTPIVGNTGPYCPGSPIQLTSNVYNATTYTWSGPSNYSSSSQAPIVGNATAAMGGVYTLTTAVGNCKKTASTTVSVHPQPVANPANNSPVCLGQPINFTSSAAASYTWTGPNGFTSNLQNPVIASSALNMAGTYTLKITTAQGCTAVATVSLAVLSPTTSASNTGPYCAGATIQLNAPTGASSYSWTGPNSFTSLLNNPTIANSTTLATGLYTVKVSIGSCTAMATTSVTVNALPTPTAGNTGPYCLNQPVQVNVNAFNTYTWSGPNSFSSNNQSPSVVITSSMVNAGPYVVAVTDGNGCVNTATTTVVINPLPVIAVNNPTTCLGNNLVFSANGGTAYAWAGPSGFSSALQNPTITNVTLASSGNYTVTVTSGFGCVNTAISSATVIPLPNVSITGGSTLCSQNFNGSPNTVVINGNGANSYNFVVPPGYIGSPNLTSPTFTLYPPVVSVLTVNQLSVTGTGAYGCTNTAVFNVTVVPNPTIVPAPASSSVCQGVSMNLGVSGASTYTWFPSASLNTNIGPNVIASPLSTTIYSIIGTQNGCNSATQTSTLLVVPNPTVTIVPGTPSICIGDAITLTASGATTYTWVPNTAINTTSGPVVIANPVVNLTYSVFGTQNTCTHVAAVTVTVLSLPIVNVSVSSPTMCMSNYNGSPNTVSLTASGALSYTWGAFLGMTPNQTTGSSIIGTSILQSAIATGTVRGFDGACYNSAQFGVAAIPNPTISVTSGSLCFGTSLALTATGATDYTWSPNSNISSTNGSTVSVSPPSNFVYAVFGSSVGCNSTTDSSHVLVVPLPVLVVAPGVPTICAGQSIGLTAAGATDYTWTPASSLNTNTGPIVSASPMVTTNYTVIGSALTCTSSYIRQVKVTPLPVIQASATKTALCKGEKTTINANGSGTYTWSPPFGLSDPHSNFVTVQPMVSTTYSIFGENGPCINSAVFPITVLEFPVMELSTNLQKVCKGNSTSIFANGSQSYKWAPEDGITHVNNNMVTVTPTASTNYTVQGYNSSGTVICMMAKEILIDVVPSITATASRSVQLCKGESVKLSAGGSNTYRWGPSAGLSNSLISNPYASPKETTTYTVRVSDGGYCESTATVLVEVFDTPTVNAGPDMVYNVDEPIYLNARGTGTLSWILGEGIMCKDCPDTQIMPQNSGCYQVMAVGKHGCKSIDEVCIEITKDGTIYIPNVFTPNYDGLNDMFLVYGTGLTKVEMIIFDRWGEKLYTSSEQLKGWDGTHNDEECKQDVYTYLVNYTGLDGKKHTKTGHVTLLR